MSFYDTNIQGSYYYNSPSRVFDMNMLEPLTRAAVRAILADSLAAGRPLLVWETYRSSARQHDLWLTGKSQLQNVGVHHWGLAADIVHNDGGSPSWQGDFSFLGVLAQKYGLIWGGDWGAPGRKHDFIDAYHVQRCSIHDQGRLFAGSFYPDDKYDPYDNIVTV